MTEQETITAFVVVDRPVIIPGIEGRITKDVGPFFPAEESPGKPSKYLEALIGMAQNGTLKVVQVSRDQVKILGGPGGITQLGAGPLGGGAKLEVNGGLVTRKGEQPGDYLKVL